MSEDVLVCTEVTEPLYIKDNATGPCSECGTMVQFRPHGAHYRRICTRCALHHISEGAEIGMDMRMVEDFIEYLKGKAQ